MLEEDLNSVQSTALEESCANRDVSIVDLLLKNGARDDDCKALIIAFKNKDETLVAKLLSTKVKDFVFTNLLIILFYFISKLWKFHKFQK